MRTCAGMSPWPRRRGWIGLWLWLLLGSWLGGAPAPGLAQQPDAVREQSYVEITQDMIWALNAATHWLKSDKWSAAAALRSVRGSVDKLGGMTGRLRELADSEHDHCIEQIAALEGKIGELYVQEQGLAHQVDELEAQLARAAESKVLAEADIARLQEQMEATAAGLRERERKLRELRDWWWVPGYGQYLAIRTLADEDADAYNRLAGTLQDTAGLARESAAAAQAAVRALEELTTARQQNVGTIERLQRMRASAQEQLGELKQSAVFLVNAGTFWGKVRNLLNLDITPELGIQLYYLEMELAGDVSAPAFDDPGREYTMDLQESLLQFAATVDNGSNFLLEEGNEYCGGPPGAASSGIRPRRRSSAPTRRRSRPYAPKARGCAPRASRTGSGGNRCASPAAIDDGPLAGAEQCEQTGLSAAGCVFRTSNRADDFMPGSIRERRGGTPALPPHRKDWGGFVAAGTRP